MIIEVQIKITPISPPRSPNDEDAASQKNCETGLDFSIAVISKNKPARDKTIETINRNLDMPASTQKSLPRQETELFGLIMSFFIFLSRCLFGKMIFFDSVMEKVLRGPCQEAEREFRLPFAKQEKMSKPGKRLAVFLTPVIIYAS